MITEQQRFEVTLNTVRDGRAHARQFEGAGVEWLASEVQRWAGSVGQHERLPLSVFQAAATAEFAVMLLEELTVPRS